ncbi:MAG: hypothetical protein Q9169_000344 [Polycauliona sp. 2 TL-2023]
MRTSSSGVKRARTDDPSHPEPDRASTLSALEIASPLSDLTANTPSSTFRNVSACHRCRLRKNRCDQNLPACSLCAKAGTRCVGFDPITKREIPRAYVYYLESRLGYLETLLTDHGITFAQSQDFDLGAKPIPGPAQGRISSNRRVTPTTMGPHDNAARLDDFALPQEAPSQKDDGEDKLNDLVSNISMASVRGSTDHRYLGTTSGISFARIVFSAVKSSVANASSEKGASTAPKPAATASGTSMRDSLFGLHTTPSVQPAPFPDRALGLQLVTIYFSFSNPQLPVLHKGEFMGLFERVYALTAPQRSSRELYMLNIVFAIGAGIFLEDSHLGRGPGSASAPYTSRESDLPDVGRLGTTSQQHQAEEYHAAAMMHLESFPNATSAMASPDGFGCGLEELQAVLLLAGFALLRPVPPGLWYIVGVATRLGIDLGLHHEGGTDLDETGAVLRQHQARGRPNPGPWRPDAEERGRREWMRDLRRRLWWCVYSFDRLVSTCVGRPFGITDQVITTGFPALLNDEQITQSGFAIPCESFTGPSYKRVSHHYFRLRLLQSEILQVLQYRQAKQAHVNSDETDKQYMHIRLSSSFLQPFESFRIWRQDIDRRLWEWKVSAPLQEDTTVHFDVRFLELNYWQMIIMLYRQSLGVEPERAGRDMSSDDVLGSMPMDMDDDTDDEDVHLKIAEAGQRVLVLYRQLHRIHLVNYTYLATVHLFMAGIAYLYVLWHSSTVRSRTTLDDVDFTILAATSVLGDLSDKCPPAEACRDAFERMSKATVKMCLSIGGFGSPARVSRRQYRADMYQDGTNGATAHNASILPGLGQLPRPRQPQLDGYVDNVGQDEQGLGASTWGLQANQETTTVSAQTPEDLSLSCSDSAEQAPPNSCTIESNASQDLPCLDLEDFHSAYTDTLSDLLLANTDSMAYDTGFGTNLGFGMEHDWSDGLQLDLFDGFFFGGNANNSG